MTDRTKIIVSAGMPRSGSTWLYNALRFLLQDRYSECNLVCGWCEDVDLAQVASDIVLLKVHSFERKIADRANAIFYSFRDIRDALASYKRKFGKEPSVQMANHFVRHDRLWRGVSHYNMRYEKMIENPEGVLGEIASVLVPDRRINYKNILNKIERLRFHGDENGEVLYHKVNLLHRDHITDGGTQTWEGCLDKDLLDSIELNHRDWFSENSYII